jgi:hypothetical protein|tara:strand:+ start:1659 stop:2582 length:924 start_codon:yes stop_codon:yes gene_type:complete
MELTMPEAQQELNDNEDESVEVELEQPTEAQIEIVEETVEPEVEADSNETELREHSKGVEKRINKLTAKLREAERREQAAIEIAEFTRTENENLKTQQTQTGDSFMSEFEQRLDLSKTMLEQQLKEAYDKGDAEQVAKTTKLMADTAVEEQRLNYFKQQNEQKIALDKQPAQNAPPVQKLQPKTDPKAEEWAEINEWFGNDEPMTLTALSFHNTMKAERGEGFVGSQEYYDSLDLQMKETFPHKFSTVKQKDQNSPVVASAGRKSSKPSRKSVTLSASQVAMAKKMGVPLNKYADEVAKKAAFERTN